MGGDLYAMGGCRGRGSASICEVWHPSSFEAAAAMG